MTRTFLEDEAGFRNLFISLPIGIFIIQDGKLQFTNAKYQELTGYNEHELLNVDSLSLVVPEDRKKVEEIARKMVKGETFIPYEYRAHRKDGEIRWIIGTAASIQYNGKKATLGSLMDITEQKLSDEKLLEDEIQLRTVIETVKNGITFSDEEGHFAVYNTEMEKLTGYSIDEANASSDFTLLLYPDQEERNKTLAVLRELTETGIFRETETKIHTKDGQEKYILVSTTIVPLKGRKMFLSAYHDITERKLAEEELKQTTEKLRKTLMGTIQALSLTVEARDPYTSGHQKRVSNLARTIAQEMNLSKHMIESIRTAGVIHDIGKISVPAEILSKPGKLTDIEFGLIKVHPQTGYDILKDIEWPYPIAQIVLQHHERMDGSGYPNGLKGDSMFLESKILAVADVVESMVSHRPYRPALGMQVALEEIEKNRGILYDSRVVEACLQLFREKGFRLGPTPS